MTSPDPGVSPLRRRMLEDLRMRKFAPRTQAAYLRAVRQAEGEARGEPVGNNGTAVRRLSTASCCGQRRCPRAGAG